MTGIMPVNYGYYMPNQYVAQPQMQPTMPNPYAQGNSTPNEIDITDSYSQKEIRKMLERIGIDVPNMQSPNIPFSYKPRYSIKCYPSGAIVIDNTQRTNDTTEILADGSVRHVGSWHNNEIAPAGTCNDILADAYRRMSEN